MLLMPGWGVATWILSWLITSILFAVWGATVIKKKNYNPFFGFLLGFFLSFIGVIICYAISSNESNNSKPKPLNNNPNIVKDNPYSSNQKEGQNLNNPPKSKKTANTFVVKNVEFNSYHEARQYCIDRNLPFSMIEGKH